MRHWEDQPLDDLESWRNQRYTGLASVLVEEQFIEWLESLVHVVFHQVLESKPTARYVLEKDPPDCLHIPLLDRLLHPEYYLHIIRDGRDVAASLLSAHGSWGRSWTPGNILAAAARWRRFVELAREAANYGRYMEVRYEDLQRQPKVVVREILRFLGIPVENEDEIDWMLSNADARRDKGQVDTALERCLSWSGEVARRGIKVAEPVGFLGAGGGGWREWPAWKHWLFNLEGGRLLYELGYPKSPSGVRQKPQQIYDYTMAGWTRISHKIR
jgi:hypothetical protein